MKKTPDEILTLIEESALRELLRLSVAEITCANLPQHTPEYEETLLDIRAVIEALIHAANRNHPSQLS